MLILKDFDLRRVGEGCRGGNTPNMVLVSLETEPLVRGLPKIKGWGEGVQGGVSPYLEG